MAPGRGFAQSLTAYAPEDLTVEFRTFDHPAGVADSVVLNDFSEILLAGKFDRVIRSLLDRVPREHNGDPATLRERHLSANGRSDQAWGHQFQRSFHGNRGHL